MSVSDRSSSKLFESFQLGPLRLANRFVMAPLTRSRAQHEDIPGPLSALYYAQRASAGLIISEGAQISPQGKGYILTPGIYSDAQVAAWKAINDGVHAKGGKIFLQLWHVGRISHRSIQPDGALPVAPSAIKPQGQAYTEAGFVDLETPRALETDELPEIVEQFRHAAICAKAAGFDGVEVHAANGYLLDQFLRDSTNQRTDAYGGSIENRARLLLEVVAAVVEVWGSDAVGVRLSPLSSFCDIADSNPEALFSYVVQQLSLAKLVYLHVVEGETGGTRAPAGGFDLQILRRLFNGVYIANNGYDFELANQAVAQGRADLVAFGRPFIANPDLVARYRLAAALNTVDPDTFYTGAARGYTDYPSLQD